MAGSPYFYKSGSGGGLTNPMSIPGDIIVGGVAGAPQRQAVGTNGYVVAADSTATNGISYQNPANHRNHLVNGAFDYWQAGTSVTVTASGAGSPTPVYAYQADQWYVNNILGGGTIEGQITYSQNSGTLAGSLFSPLVRITVAPTGTGIQNGLELYQVLSNKASQAFYNQTASFAIQVKAAFHVTQVGLQFCYATSEAKPTNFIGAETLVNVNTSTFTNCVINGQALGTSQGTGGVIGIRIRPTAVSSGNLYDLNNGFNVEQAMLNLGPVALPFQRQFDDPAHELLSCQYFFEKIGGDVSAETLGGAYSTSTTGAAGVINFRTKKRSAPAISFSASSALTYANGSGTFPSTGLTSSNIGLIGFLAIITTSGISAGNLGGTVISNSTGFALADARI